ncbi:MAG: hypothetical protein Q8Q05_02625 [bacterium]|nr:hypothetical protein [bacterium]
MTNKNDNSSDTVKLAVLGASIAAAAATAYFFLSPEAKQHQKQAKAWAIKMKGEVVEKLEQAREVSEPVYRQIIDTVAAEYAKALKGDTKEIDLLAADLKKHWKTLSQSVKS